MQITNWLSNSKQYYSRLNKYLITQHPFIWQTQVHLVVLYALFFGLITFFIGLLYPIDFQSLCTEGDAVGKIRYNAGAVCISLSLLFLIYWRRKIVQYKTTDFVWRKALAEAGIYAFGVLLLWMASNMFSLGFNTRLAWFTLKGEKQYAGVLQRTNYFINGYLEHSDPGKIKDPDHYFQNGDSLTRQLTEAVLDPGSAGFSGKKYHSLLNNYVLDNLFFTSDSSSSYVDSTEFVYYKGKKRYGSYWKTSFYTDQAALAKFNNLTQIDTLLGKSVYSKLKYSFDEFVPKLNYDNYQVFNWEIPTTRLFYPEYKKMTADAGDLVRSVMFDDFIRALQAQKWVVARQHFITCLTPAEKSDYLRLLDKINVVYGVGDPMFYEAALHYPLSDLAPQKDQNENGGFDKDEHNAQRILDTEQQKRYDLVMREIRQMDSTATQQFRADSTALAAAFGQFERQINPEAGHWYRAYLGHVRTYYEAIVKAGNVRSIPIKHLFARADSLSARYPFTLFDTVMIGYDRHPLHYWYAGAIQDAADSLMYKLLEDGKTAPFFGGLVTRTDSLTALFDKKYEYAYYKWDNYGYYSKFYEIMEETRELRSVLFELIKAGAFPELYAFPIGKTQDLMNTLREDYFRFAHLHARWITTGDSVKLDRELLKRETSRMKTSLRQAVLADPQMVIYLDSIKQYLFNRYDYMAFFTRYGGDYAFSGDTLFREVDKMSYDYHDRPLRSLMARFFDRYHVSRQQRWEEKRYPANDEYMTGLLYMPTVYYQQYKARHYATDYIPANLSFFKLNGFYVPEGVTDSATAFRYISYYGLDMGKGMLEVFKARKAVWHFFSEDVFQRHILSLLIFLNAILFFSVSFETRVLTAAFALGFLLLILLNFFLGKFLDANELAHSTDFPSIKQKIVFATLLVPLGLSLLMLFFTRRRTSIPGFLMNMVVVFALSLLTTNPNLYYGDNLQQVENPRVQAATQPRPLTQLDLFYYLTLYLGVTLTAGSVLLRRNQVLPEKRG